VPVPLAWANTKAGTNSSTQEIAEMRGLMFSTSEVLVGGDR
jgi:hypothetical protein